MTTKVKRQAQNPLILRAHRLMEAFAKSDDERDFYLDREEGFIVYVDLDKDEQELLALENELKTHAHRYCLIPKLTFYETKKIMEGFVNEKVYDIDTKEKLLDIIQSKEARDHFLEFIYDHHSELEKWQQFYQERWRIRIIEWLRKNDFQFVFEEDLDLTRKVIEKLKESLFDARVGKDIIAARKALAAKAKTYYSNEALNPRPKRGRPPKQTVKLEVEPQVTTDIYTAVPPLVRPFLFTPDISSASAITFSSNFESQQELLANRGKGHGLMAIDTATMNLNQKLASLRSLTQNWSEGDEAKESIGFDEEEEDEEESDEFDLDNKPSKQPINGKSKDKGNNKVSKKAPLPDQSKKATRPSKLKPLRPLKSAQKVDATIPKAKKAAAPPPPPKKKKLLPLTRIKTKKK